MTNTIALRFRHCLVAVVFLLLIGTVLSAQTPAAPAQTAPPAVWATYNYSADGFSISFPAEPQVQKRNVPTVSGTLELRTYIVSPGSAALYVAVCDYGAAAVGSDPQVVLTGAKNGAINNMKAHILTEKNVTLDAYPGVRFEAESDAMHLSVRIYFVGTTLYQTLIASPLNGRYTESARFLDSFKLTKRVAPTVPPAIWKTYSYSADGFSISLPSEPEIGKKNVSTNSGTYGLRSYLVSPDSFALYVGVCDYGAAVAGSDPQELLTRSKNGAVNNVKAHILTEQKITLGSYPGVQFEAENDAAHISPR